MFELKLSDKFIVFGMVFSIKLIMLFVIFGVIIWSLTIYSCSRIGIREGFEILSEIGHAANVIVNSDIKSSKIKKTVEEDIEESEKTEDDDEHKDDETKYEKKDEKKETPSKVTEGFVGWKQGNTIGKYL